MTRSSGSSALRIGALSLLVVFGGALLWVKQRGLLAISDDDYARVVIAQKFALNPRLDPSGTSWLPLPFIMTGSSMSVLGATLSVARATSFSASLVGALLLFWTGLRLEATVVGATSAVLACCLMGSSLWLAPATVPEFPTAILMVVGALSLLSPLSSRLRLVGSLCLLAATASRYEAWPVALAFSSWSAFDYARGVQRDHLHESRTWVPACSALSFMIAWMSHGAITHGSPLFFVDRVTRYKQALEPSSPELVQALMGYPKSLVELEPLSLLFFSISVSLVFFEQARQRGSGRLRGSSDRLVPLVRPMSLLLMQVLVLVFGDLRGGAPTHHPERALLMCWMLFAFLAVWLIDRALPSQPASKRLLVLIPAIIATSSLFGSRLSQLVSESRLRAAEESLGRRIFDLGHDGPVAVHTADYGYFAIMAAAGHPSRFTVVDDHDPRGAHSEDLDTWLRVENQCTFVSPTDQVRSRVTLLAEAGSLGLFQLPRCADQDAPP